MHHRNCSTWGSCGSCRIDHKFSLKFFSSFAPHRRIVLYSTSRSNDNSKAGNYGRYNKAGFYHFT
ncbi:MAG: hypothetical protein VZQ49_04800 [Methanobrevibacter sp.]|nr:hypothetical protein [Methanobrevibacter sp.]